jgi:hypothetical protein
MLAAVLQLLLGWGAVDDDIKQNRATLCKFGVRVSTGGAAEHQAPNSHGRSSRSR